MTRYTTPGGSLSVWAEPIPAAGLVLTFDQHGQAGTEYACEGDYLTHWPDSSSSILAHDDFNQLFPCRQDHTGTGGTVRDGAHTQRQEGH